MSPSLLAILVATVLSTMLGFVWYSKPVLGRPWMKLKGFTDKSLSESSKKMGKMYALSMLGTLLQAVILTNLFYWVYVTTIIGAVFLAIWVWLGFIFVTQLTSAIFSDKPFSPKLLAIETGYQFFSMVLMAIVIGWFQ